MIQALVIEAKDPSFFIVPIDNSIDPKTNRMPMTTGILDYMSRFNSNSHYNTFTNRSGWQIKKFAYKLKQVVTLLTGIPTEDLEKEEVKSMVLPQEWNYTFQGGSKISYPKDSGPEWDFSKYQMTVRELLQKLGTEAIRNQVHPNAWVNALFADWHEPWVQYSGCKSLQPCYWLISDCRFPNEAQAIKDRGGIVIKIHRRDIGAEMIYEVTGYPKQRHESETALKDWEFDYYLDNFGTLDDLLINVRGMLRHYNIII